MTDLLAVAALAALPIVGTGVLALPEVKRLDRAGRLAFAFGGGVLLTGGVLVVFSALAIPWSRTAVLPVLLALAVGGRILARRTEVDRRREALDPVALVGVVVTLLVLAYGCLTARVTCADLYFFWGPRAIHFNDLGGISAAYLREPSVPNGGYPPLLPLLYSWMLIVSGRFSWWIATATAALFVAAAAAAVRSVSGDDRGTLLFTAGLASGVGVSQAAGGADPMLVFFEVLALVVLGGFRPGSPSQVVIGAAALAGCAMAKVEGATFVIAVTVAMLVTRHPVRRVAAVVAPASLLTMAWILFVRSHDIVDQYRGAAKPLFLDAVPGILRQIAAEAAYEMAGLPWVAAFVLIAVARDRRVVFPLLVALLTLGGLVFYYAHVREPRTWIAMSAGRVMLTPLVAVLVAALRPAGYGDEGAPAASPAP